MTENIVELSNHELVEQTKRLVSLERETTLRVLRFLAELDRRKIYLERGFSSLFSFAVEVLGYEPGAASRRIASMRLLKEIPAIEEKIKTGKLSLTTVTQAAYFFKAEEKKVSVTFKDKQNILKTLEGKSKREAEKVLLELSPDNSSLNPERIRVVSPVKTEMTVTLNEKTLQKLKTIQERCARKLKDTSYASLIEFLADEVLEQIEPSAKQIKRAEELLANTSESVSAHESRGFQKVEETLQRIARSSGEISESEKRRADSSSGKTEKYLELNIERELPRHRPAIGLATKRVVFLKSNYQCTFTDPITRRRCTERKYLELDHVRPYAKGGASNLENLRCLCRAHNVLMAEKHYGKSWGKETRV